MHRRRSVERTEEGSILRNESGPATTAGEREREEGRKAGKKDKGRSDEGIYPILAGVAAGCRVQEGFEGSLIGSPRTESTERQRGEERSFVKQEESETDRQGSRTWGSRS